MKAVLLLAVLLICCLCLGYAAPADDNSQQVHFLKYKSNDDFEAIQRQIIAQYEKLGGSSQFHHIKTASVVDPQNFNIQI